MDCKALTSEHREACTVPACQARSSPGQRHHVNVADSVMHCWHINSNYLSKSGWNKQVKQKQLQKQIIIECILLKYKKKLLSLNSITSLEVQGFTSFSFLCCFQCLGRLKPSHTLLCGFGRSPVCATESTGLSVEVSASERNPI